MMVGETCMGNWLGLWLYIIAVDVWFDCILLLYLNFVGVAHCKPSRDHTRPPGTPGGLKGLLHTLNATVIPTKVS